MRNVRPDSQSQAVTWDRGLQPERTSLAWTRTSSVLLLNAVVMLRSGFVGESLPLLVLSCALLAASAAVFWYARMRRARLVAGFHPLAPPALVMRGVATVTLIACLTGVLAIWSSHAT